MISKDAAYDLLTEAMTSVGDEALRLIVTPSIERTMRGDVQIVDLQAQEGKGLTRAVRTSGLGARLKRAGLPDELIRVGLRFARDFDKARIGGLTASYDGAGGSKRSCEPERWCEAIDLLSRASSYLDADMRLAVYGCTVLDVSMADLGQMIGGCVSGDKNNHVFTGKLFLRKALIKLELFYEDWDYVAERLDNERKTA